MTKKKKTIHKLIETTHKLKRENRQNLTKKTTQETKNTTIIDTETAQNTSKDNKTNNS